MALIEARSSHHLTQTIGTNIMSSTTNLTTAYDYRQFIKSTAESILEDVIAQEGLDVHAVDATMYEAVTEVAQSTEVAIYNRHHLNVIQHSEYADEFCNEFGNEYAGDVLAKCGLDGLHAGIALYCIEADIWAWLRENAEDIIETRIAELGAGEEEE